MSHLKHLITSSLKVTFHTRNIINLSHHPSKFGESNHRRGKSRNVEYRGEGEGGGGSQIGINSTWLISPSCLEQILKS